MNDKQAQFSGVCKGTAFQPPLAPGSEVQQKLFSVLVLLLPAHETGHTAGPGPQDGNTHQRRPQHGVAVIPGLGGVPQLVVHRHRGNGVR